MCTLTCRMTGKGLQITKGVNSLENSNDLFSKQAWNGIFRNPFCLIPLPFSIPRVSKPAEYTVMQSLWPLQRKDWKPRDREFPCRELTFPLSFLCLHRVAQGCQAGCCNWRVIVGQTLYSPASDISPGLGHGHLQTTSSCALNCWASANSAHEEFMINLVLCYVCIHIPVLPNRADGK